MKRVAIQGRPGSFHDLASRLYFEGEEIELCCCDSFEDLFQAMDSDGETLGMMAIENTIAGSLLHNYELLRDSGKAVVGEYKLHIEHSLLCLPDEDLSDLTEVNSHPVALMQCRNFLQQFRGKLKIVEADDTAGAAEAIHKRQLRGHAAICSKYVAPLYGMKVLMEAIEDNKHNYTRFLALCAPEKVDILMAQKHPDKCSLVFTVPHERGGLSQVLSVLSFYDINMTKIQSLPIIGKEWEYMFYVDAAYSNYTRYRQCIEAIRPLTGNLKILGEYESHK